MTANILKSKFINVPHCGKLKVYIQGDDTKSRLNILTVHDVGYNHNTFVDFVQCQPMTEMAKRTTWIHVTLPGQDDNEEHLPDSFQYPTLDNISLDLLTILDTMQIDMIIGFGEGVGANILCRFGLMFPNRCLGLVLLNCTSSGITADEKLMLALTALESGGQKLLNKARSLFRSSKFEQQEKKKLQPECEENINPDNVSKLFVSYTKRTDISKWLEADLNVDCFVVAGKVSPSRYTCQEMVIHMDKIKTTLLIIDDVYDVLYEAQKEFTRSLILFCKGCGVLLGVPMLGLESAYKKVQDKQHEISEIELKFARQIQMYEKMLDD